MARVTKADLEKQLDDYRRTFDIMQTEINNLNKELDKTLNNQDVVSKVEFNSVLKSLEHERLIKEQAILNYKRLEDKLDRYNGERNEYIDRILELESKVQQLNSELLDVEVNKIKTEQNQVYNERGAGRKPKLTTEQRKQVIAQYKEKRKTMDLLAKEFGVSKATIFNIINKR